MATFSLANLPIVVDMNACSYTAPFSLFLAEAFFIFASCNGHFHCLMYVLQMSTQFTIIAIRCGFSYK